MDNLLRRLALLVEIADRKRDRPGRLGKTAMQKLIYLLQEVYEVNFGYRFTLYTYGPYEASVARDVDYAGALSLLLLEYDHDRGYEITCGPKVGQLDENRRVFCAEAGSQLDELFEHFGDLTARQLELRATLVFIAKDGTSIAEGELRKQIRHLKPKYDQGEIDEAVDSLRKLEILGEVCWQN